MKVKLAAQLGSLEQCSFFGIFLDLRKAYDAMDQGRCLKILHGVGVDEKTVWLIARFWKESGLCCRATGFYGRLFKVRCGVTQGSPLSPTIFNLMVDSVMREWERQLMAGGAWPRRCLAAISLLLRGRRAAGGAGPRAPTAHV